jgi:hypothetical protein
MYGQFFEECPDALAQQSLLWSDIIAPISPDTPYFLVVCDQGARVLGAIPLYHFIGDFGGILTSVPHAGPLGGCLCHGDLNGDMIRRVYATLLEGSMDLARELKCISLTIITNPLLQDAELYKAHVRPQYVLNNFTQVIDLRKVFSDSGRYNTGKARYNNHIYKNLAKAKSAGIIVEWGGKPDFNSWYEIHCKRHGELGKTPLPRPLLQGIMDIMKPEDSGGLAVIKIKDQIIGGCLYIWNKETADAFIMSGDSDYFEYGINHAVTDFALRYFRKHGLKWFNWQSSRRSSGVYTFKERWGSQERGYQFLTWTFPGFENVFAKGADEISKSYEWHYVAPFEAIKKKMTQGVFDKI